MPSDPTPPALSPQNLEEIRSRQQKALLDAKDFYPQYSPVIIDSLHDVATLLADVERLRTVLKIIREAGNNEDMTACWMQRWAAWGMDSKFPKPTPEPSNILYPHLP